MNANVRKYADEQSKRLGLKDYESYLKSEHWRIACKTLQKQSCYCCKSNESTLIVRHTRFHNLLRETKQDVVTVCESCGELIDDLIEKGSRFWLAHFDARIVRRGRGKRLAGQWVSWFKLCDRESGEHYDDVLAFLVEKGLSDGEKATEMAYRLGYAKEVDGKERWELAMYVRLRENDRKLKRKVAAGVSVHPMLYERSLTKKNNESPRHGHPRTGTAGG